MRQGTREWMWNGWKTNGGFVHVGIAHNLSRMSASATCPSTCRSLAAQRERELTLLPMRANDWS